MAIKDMHVYMLAFDIFDSTNLTPEEFSNIPLKLFERISARIKEVGIEFGEDYLIDKKTVGDGFLLYFESASACLKVAFKIKHIFEKLDFGFDNRKLKCRIALNYGTCFLFEDFIEERQAIFSRNIIPLARLEPVVRSNEIWCTEAFHTNVFHNENEADAGTYKFKSLGNIKFAKGWAKGEVFAVYMDGEDVPADLQKTLIECQHPDYGDTLYICFLELSSKGASGISLEEYFSKNSFSNVSIYYIYGSFDVVVKFTTTKKINQDDLKKILQQKKIIKKKRCNLLKVHNPSQNINGPLISFQDKPDYFKSFILLESNQLERSDDHRETITDFIEKTAGKSIEYITYYNPKGAIVLEIVIPNTGYYLLSDFIEKLEEEIESEGTPTDSTTYMVHSWKENSIQNVGGDEE